jgi:hypothetical protein
MLKEVGLVVFFALATVFGTWHTLHAGHKCLTQIQKVAKLMKHGDPPDQKRG